MAKRRITSRPGLFGAVYYYDDNGKPVGKSRPGLLSGTRIYTDQNGQHAGKSRSGFLAKEVFTDTDHNHITSYEGFCGDAHLKDGVPIGYTRPGFFGLSHTVLKAAPVFVDEDHIEENLLDVSSEVDVIDEEENAPEMNQKHVVKNVLLLLLCVLAFVVISCFCASK